MNSRGLGGPTILPEQYDRISDWDLLHIYLAPRDKDGELITLRDRMAYATGQADEIDSESDQPAEDPIAATGIPRQAFLMGPPVQYTMMFWKIWRARGLDDKAVMQKFKEKVKDVPPLGNYG